jgi:beta-lactamase regulating signal transducer with metallopeptidase domain
MMALLLDHLWQSSFCACGAGVLSLALHRNGADVRFWLWFAASVKFLIPFAAVTALGAIMLTPILPPMPAPAVTAMKPLAQPFSAKAAGFNAAPAPAPTAVAEEPALAAVPMAAPSLSGTSFLAIPAAAFPAANPRGLEIALLTLWLAGFMVLAFRWLVRWLGIRALLRDATPLQVDAPVTVKFSTSWQEPGLVGILRPIIMLPHGIEQQLSPAELKAILAHEFCHWRRNDNLLAAIHMLVEALFWFFPLVWWLGARLNAERERACDESVVATGNDPETYAEGILKVCRSYLQSPLPCVAGVSGASLKKRIRTILENELVLQLNATRKVALSVSAGITLVVPLALGLAASPIAQKEARATTSPSRFMNDQGNTNEAPVTSGDSPLTERNRSNTPIHKATDVPHGRIQPATIGQPKALLVPMIDLSGLLLNVSLPTPALHEVPTATAIDQPADSAQPPAPRRVQGSLPDLTPANSGSHEPTTVYTCRNSKVFGRAISPEAIQLQGFRCFLEAPQTGEVRYGSCPLTSTAGPSFISTGTLLRQYDDDASPQGSRLWSRGRGSCPFDVTMNVKLADTAEASKMQPGKMLSLAGVFRIRIEHHIAYLTVTNAKVTWVDTVGRPWKPNQPSSGGLEIEAFYNSGLAPSVNIPPATYR